MHGELKLDRACSSNLGHAGSRWVKRVSDVVGASLLLVAVAPIMLLAAWLVWREDGGPVMFNQVRLGEQGKGFEFLKFRSMARDADAVLQRWEIEEPELYKRYVASNFKLADDPRLLRVGRWMRRNSIDELPQLINVIRGEMSLVGPRPLLERELGDYPPDAWDLYTQVKPGITGLWQVSGRSRTSFRERAELDLRYVRNWSLGQDFVILLKTWKVVFARDGAY